METKLAVPEPTQPRWRLPTFIWAAVCAVLPLAAVLLSGWLQSRRQSVNPPNNREYSLNYHQRAVQRLAAAANGAERADALLDAAKTTVYFGSLDQAQQYATELLALVKEDAEQGRRLDGNMVHDGHVVLGLVALRQGRMDEAKKELLLAGGTPGSPHLVSFGPNMLLAKELLEHGEAAVVIQYFEACRRFWEMDRGRLDRWTKDAREGRTPDFGTNLLR